MNSRALTAARAKVNSFFKTFGANANPQLLRSPKGKVYELYCLAKTIEFLRRHQQVRVQFVGKTVDFKASPGKVDKTKSYFVISGKGPSLELHTNVEVRTLSAATGVTGPSSCHEIDIALIEHAQNRQRPEHDQIVLGIECKAHALFKKRIVREVLGVRRELSLLRLGLSRLRAFLVGQRHCIRAEPASEYWLAFTDPRGNKYRPGPRVFEIKFKHWLPDPGPGRGEQSIHSLGDFTTAQPEPLLEHDVLLNRFVELLRASTQVDIAVAWAGPGLAVERLVEYTRRGRVRMAVGLSGNNTEPATLRRLMAAENVELRVAPAPREGVFHPKFYRFLGAQGTVCWIGSANFTRGGFGGNAELVHEFSDWNDVGGAWFEAFWKSLDEDPEPAVARYEEWHRPPKARIRRGRIPTGRERLPHLEDIDSWDEFVAALQVLDEYCHRRELPWDILGKTHSYLHTIGVGSEVARRGNWENFSLRDRDILLGLDYSDNSAWGLLGSLRGAGAVVSAFSSPGNPEYRSLVFDRIQRVIAAGEEGIVEAADAAVADIRELNRFGPAAATRFLALACPGWLVSVNGPSAAGLGVFAGMESDESHLASNYAELIEKIHAREWWRAPGPTNSFESEIWRCRAALVDALVYIPYVLDGRAEPRRREVPD